MTSALLFCFVTFVSLSSGSVVPSLDILYVSLMCVCISLAYIYWTMSTSYGLFQLTKGPIERKLQINKKCLGKNYPTTLCNNPEELVPTQSPCGNLKSLFLCCQEYIYLTILSSPFFMSCCCMTDFLWNKMINVFIIIYGGPSTWVCHIT